MSEVIVERERSVALPYARCVLIPRENLTLSRIPDMEIRVKHADTDVPFSEFLKLTQDKLSPQEAKTVDLTLATEVLVDWLVRRYGKKGMVPIYYKSWEELVKWKLLPFLFADRLKNMRPAKSFQSMLEAGPGHNGPQLKLHLNGSKNFYVNSTYYQIPETEREGKGPLFVFEASYDSSIKYDGAVAGLVDVFGVRQAICVRHRFVNLQANFEYEDICNYAVDRINTLLPGIVTKGLIWNFQWLGKDKFFGGDEPWPLTAGDARTIANEHKEAV